MTVVTDAGVVMLAVVVVFSVRSGSLTVGLLAGLVVGGVLGTRARSPWVVIVVILLASGGAVRSQHSWAGLAPDSLGPFAGWVRLIDDPQPYPSSTRVIVEIESERFEMVPGPLPAATGAIVARWRVDHGRG